MNRSKYILGALALVLAASAASARQLTVDEAIAAARVADGRVMTSPATVARTYTFSENGLNTLYVVPATSGFYVLAADDVAPALLGYADSGSFDFDNMPSNLRAWLDDYSAYISYAASNGLRVVAALADPVEPNSGAAQIDVSTLSPGHYLLRVTTPTSTRTLHLLKK